MPRRTLALSKSRRRFALGGLALTAAILAIAVPGATASLAPDGRAASKLRVVITERGSFMPAPPSGKFTMGGAAGSDSGTTVITPSGEGPARMRNGQEFHEVGGSDHLTGKNGELILQLTGVSVDAGGGFAVEYGTWRILAGFGTGMYEAWTGGGRWVAIDNNGRRYSIRFEGLVTG